MSMGRRREERQGTLFVAANRLPKAAGHPFYQRLNQLLAEAGFDAWIEGRCRQYYATTEARGRPSIAPGAYFRMLLVGYFEGIDSQRGIAWRCADSLGLRQFLGPALDEPSPDHSTLTDTRKRLPAEVFEEVFQLVLSIAAVKGLLAGKAVGVDSTTLEANAAMKSIVRKDTGEDWRAYVVRLMREEGVIGEGVEPTDEDVRRFDKGRKDKRVSNDDWRSPTDPEGRSTRLKDGRTHLAYQAEHRLQRLRSERVERSFAHVCDSGGARRCWLRGLANVAKRYLITVAAHNLGRVMWKLFGIGKPRGLQGGLGLAALVQWSVTAIRSCRPEITRALARLTPMTKPIAA
jgi:transposase